MQFLIALLFSLKKVFKRGKSAKKLVLAVKPSLEKSLMRSAHKLMNSSLSGFGIGVLLDSPADTQRGSISAKTKI